MSLHFTLSINGRSIHHTVAIQRITPKKPVPADSTICTYQVDLFTPGDPDSDRRLRRSVVGVEHRYGDGPMELVRKALNALHNEEADRD